LGGNYLNEVTRSFPEENYTTQNYIQGVSGSNTVENNFLWSDFKKPQNLTT